MECKGQQPGEIPYLDANNIVREISFTDSDLSFPEHHAVVFPKNQSFSYLCDADSEDENTAKRINSSENTDQSDVISDQDLRFLRDVEDASGRRRTQKCVPAIPASEIVDDSCVAVFHEISGEIEQPLTEELTFNGKIPTQTASIHMNVDESIFNCSSTTILDSSQASLQIDLSASSILNTTQDRQAMKLMENGSPDILGYESDDEEVKHKNEDRSAFDLSLLNHSDQEDCLTRRDRKTLKRLHNALAGVLPPPSFTKSHLSVEEIISVFERNSSEMFSRTEIDDHGRDLVSLMKPMNSMEEAVESTWPDAKDVFTHGIHYNRSKYTERIESLSVKFAERFIGAETNSSFVKLTSPSSAKKRYLRSKKAQSPGRRLSHLAKRKAMFSCANLQKINFSSSQPCLSQNSMSRQIMVEPSGSRRSRLGRVTTPKRLLQRKTLSSTQKDIVDVKVAPTRETSRRALFQSPPQQSSARSALSFDVSERVDRSKRALFSSPKLNRYSSLSQSTTSFSTMSQGGQSASSLTEMALANRENMFNIASGKRKRGHLEDDDDMDVIQKVARMDGHFGRSQSFTAEYVARQNALMSTKTSLSKTTSDVCLSGRDRTGQYNFLTDLEKQKLLYIVSQTLQQKQISGQHERFKEYATIMAKVVKRLFLESNRRSFASVSEKMSKIANSVLCYVLQGKSVEEIYAVEHRKRSSNEMKSLRASGYAPMESSRSMYRSTSSLTSENSKQSFGVLNQNSLRFSQSDHLSQSSRGSFSGTTDTGSILRENVDSEQRQKSAQKGLFSGKDQKNVSPHVSGHKSHKLVGGKNIMNLLKAKRQISFDT